MKPPHKPKFRGSKKKRSDSADSKNRKRKPPQRFSRGKNSAGKKRGRPADQTPAKIPNEIDVEVVGLTDDGEPFGMVTDRRLRGHFPRVLFAPDEPVKLGDVVPTALTEIEPGLFRAKVKPQTAMALKPLIGQIQRKQQHWVFVPFNRELQAVGFIVPSHGAKISLQENMVVLARPGRRPSIGATPVEVIEVLGNDIRGLETAIAIENHGVPIEFSSEALAECEGLPGKLSAAEVAEREDLRQIPIVTIDGADARDFDDAVWAEKTDQGWHIIVAIADVAHYIKEGGALDTDAEARGNSTYFPDRVIPMLPERLSNDLCSLRPHEDRPVLAVHMYLDERGELKKQKFVRGVIHSHARLTYDQVQAALDGQFDEQTGPLWETTLAPLQAVYKVLLKQRDKRGAIDLDVPEPMVQLDDKGNIVNVIARDRKDSHRIIEELMILANVAAATALETNGMHGLYRVHEEPDSIKLDRLGAMLASVGFKTKHPKEIKPSYFQQLAQKIRSNGGPPLMMQMLLQSQKQARYDPQNIGHFGLALLRYSHFTSPIRRYADLIVHRALIKAMRLPGQGALKLSPSKLPGLGEHINVTERRSQQAEWESRDRLIVNYQQKNVGQNFKGHVISVQPFGVFVQLEDQISEGLLPVRLLRDDHYKFDDKKHQLVGLRSGKILKMGQPIKVTLLAADPLAGQLTFAPVGGQATRPQQKAGRDGRRPSRVKPKRK